MTLDVMGSGVMQNVEIYNKILLNINGNRMYAYQNKILRCNFFSITAVHDNLIKCLIYKIRDQCLMNGAKIALNNG